ncbi:MAG TPA: OstA-like protein [Dysgonamonadaceae bacterium]|nr:OstA-like protein [Dysgonamonadaceae bacterium]
MKQQKKDSNNYSGNIFFAAIGVLFALVVGIYAQQPPPVSLADKNIKIIELKQADLLYKRQNFNAQILKDSVILYHEGAYMYCDSAYWYERDNIFEAFSNVRMEQGDTIFVYGDYLHYDGNRKLARLRYNVRMEDQRATLFTDSLDYDRLKNLGYYFDGGMLVDDENELTSTWGQYNPTSKEALFSENVKLVNEKYTLYADTLKYNTETKIVDILGPSTLVSDSGYIYTTRGWYNTATDDCQLLNRSQVISKDSTQILIGDTIYYNRNTGIGKVYGHMFLQDTVKKVILKGNYGYYNEKTEFALATDSAYAIEYSQKDSLYIHADTLKMITDSLGKEMKAYPNARFYRIDLQGICDTMHYVSKDSTIYLKKDPVIWNEDNQILGDRIDILLNDSTIEKAFVRYYAFTIQKRPIEDQYNQLKGRNMTVSFLDGEIRHVLVEGSAESLYYLMEKDSTIIGVNKTESPFLSMDIVDNKLEKLKLWSATKGVTIPLSQAAPEDKALKGFVWMDYLRPINKDDIFRKTERKVSEIVQPPRRFVREENL